MKKAICILILTAFMTVPTWADTYYGHVDVKYQSVAPGMTVGIYSSHTSGGSYWTGVYNIDLSSLGDTSLSAPAPAYQGVPAGWEPYLSDVVVQSFCIDIHDTAPKADDVTYDIRPLSEAPDPESAPFGGMGVLRAGYVKELLDTYWNDTYLNTGNSTVDNLHAAALQTAVWEIVDEGSQLPSSDLGPPDPDPAGWDTRKIVLDGTQWVQNDSDRGNFYVGNLNVANEANHLLNSIAPNGCTFTGAYVALSNPSLLDKDTNYQDYVVKVPLPAAALLGFLGLGAAGLKLRKFA